MRGDTPTLLDWMDVHRRVDLGPNRRGTAWWSRCRCGWGSQPCRNEAEAVGAYVIHVEQTGRP
jgi:hypothetical protein